MAPIAARADRHPNYLTIPDSPPSNMNDTSRDVFIAHRVMRGDGAVEDITDFVHDLERLAEIADNGVPHPMHHWGVVVGDVLHHLQADSFVNKPIWYENKKLPTDEGYILYKVGSTTFNDLAIQESGVHTIYDMDAIYRIVTNNCQNFTMKLLDIIVRSGRVQVKSAEVYAHELDIYVPVTELEKFGAEFATASVTAAVVQNPPAQEKLLQHAQAIMDEKTPTLTKDDVKEALEQQTREPQSRDGAKVPEASVVEVLPENTVK